MAKIDEVTPAAEPVTSLPKGYLPNINTISRDDIFESLKAGVADFIAAPVYGIFIGGFYALSGMLLFWIFAQSGNLWMVIPAAVGFPLIGPFIAVGFYEISRRRMAGQTRTARDIFIHVLSKRDGQIAFVGVAILCICWVWIFLARILFAIFLGEQSFHSIWHFVTVAFSTEPGWEFLAIGTFFGGIMAYILFACTVIALPLLVGRNIDVMNAIVISIKAVGRNRPVMLIWAAIVVAMLAIGMVPFFLGLIVVLPILGHATWHLYVRVIDQGK